MTQNTTHQAPSQAELDMMFDRVRAAFVAQHEAGYTTGRWASAAEGTTDEEYREARTAADESVVLAWNSIYTVLGCYRDAYAHEAGVAIEKVGL